MHLGDRCEKLSSITNNIIRHGNFFSLKLYPLKTLEKIPDLNKKIGEYLVAINELKKITNFSNDLAFQLSIEFGAEMESPNRANPLSGESIHHIELSRQIANCRKTILYDIDVLKKELQSFIDEN